MKEEEVSFVNNEGKKLIGNLRTPTTQEELAERKFPVAIICHDLAQDKDAPVIKDVFNIVSYAGFMILRFDFSGHGESEGNFEYVTLSKERADLSAAIEFMLKLPEADKTRVLVIGHGTGGTVALMEAASDERIKALALINPVIDMEHHIRSYFGSLKADLEEQGYTYLENGKKIRKEYLDDMRFQDMFAALEKLKFVPIITVYSAMDTRVPIEDIRSLYLRAREPKALEIIDSADHDFTNKALRNEMIEYLMNWINTRFKSLLR